MGYISLIKADGAVDLIPADNIVYVVGTEEQLKERNEL